MTIHTDIGYATLHDIFVRGRNLSDDIIPNADFAEMVCLCMLGRTPEPNFKRMINVLLVTSADHGFTPSSMSARLTYLGAPESLQGAVAAGLLGAGDRYLGVTQNVAEMLQEEGRGIAPDAPQAEFDIKARDILARYKAQNKRIYGVGHPIHTDGDPRVPSLRRISQEAGYYGTGWRLLDALERINASDYNRKLPINGAGAMGAIAADLKLDPKIARGLALVGRTAGLVAHLVEEASSPTAAEMWELVLTNETKPA
ncbi:citryl-CoA lyase [Variovorax sp. LARHSF232]